MTQVAGDSARSAPEGQLRQGGRALLLAFYTALRNLKLYPVENATVQRALDDLDASARALLALEADLEIRMAGDFIFVNATRLRLELDNYASFSHVLAMLRAFDVGALRIHSTASRREWQILLSLLLSLSERGQPEDRFEELYERLAAGEVQGLEIERANPNESAPDAEQAKEAAKRVYSQGVAVTKDVITGARLGRATSVKRVKRAVQLIVDQVLNNEASLVGLTTLRDYDEYTFTHSVNVCIFSVALGKKLGLSRLQLYDLGMCALLHDVGKARVPVDILNKTTGLDEREWRVMQAHPWLGALTLFTMRSYDETPYRAILTAHEHHMKTDFTGYPRIVRPRDLGIFSRIVAVADGFDAATSRRVYQTEPLTPVAVLAEMRNNPRRGMDPVIVKAFVSLVGHYPVGTLVVLDTFELAVVHAVNPVPEAISRPIVRVISDERGNLLHPGTLADLNQQDGTGRFLRTIIKLADPDRYGIRVSDYFA
jgi:HD-GYP domain-containing protein (c-di-GMP phosphodiesterase class II)